MKHLNQTIILLTIIAILNSCVNNSNKEKTTKELKQELKIREVIEFKNYLSVTASLKENITQKPDLFHHTKTDGYIISGAVKNSSMLAKFKDVVIDVTYYSETQTVIDSQRYIMYKYFNPTTETPFAYKVYPPAGFSSFQIEISNAVPVE